MSGISAQSAIHHLRSCFIRSLVFAAPIPFLFEFEWISHGRNLTSAVIAHVKNVFQKTADRDKILFRNV
jgi:hypothetical protein